MKKTRPKLYKIQKGWKLRKVQKRPKPYGSATKQVCRNIHHKKKKKKKKAEGERESEKVKRKRRRKTRMSFSPPPI